MIAYDIIFCWGAWRLAFCWSFMICCICVVRMQHRSSFNVAIILLIYLLNFIHTSMKFDYLIYLLFQFLNFWGSNGSFNARIIVCWKMQWRKQDSKTTSTMISSIKLVLWRSLTLVALGPPAMILRVVSVLFGCWVAILVKTRDSLVVTLYND